MSNLVALVNGATEVRKLLEPSALGDLLAEVEFKAAAKALEKAALARDQRGQLWTAVGHLESAYEGILEGIARFRQWHCAVDLDSPYDQQTRLEKARYALCAMAACYWYLGERELCEKQLDMAADVDCGGAILSYWALPLELVGAIPALFKRELWTDVALAARGKFPSSDKVSVASYSVSNEELAELRALFLREEKHAAS